MDTKMFLYAVYDEGLERYTPPMCCSSELEARRSFDQFAYSLDRNIYEGVFSLRLIGSFDVSSGLIEGDVPVVIESNTKFYYERLKNGKE